jgi:hypothetical protein
MNDKGRLSVEQHIKTVLFFTETRSVVVTRAVSVFTHDGQLHSKKFVNFVTTLIMMVQYLVALQISSSKSTRKEGCSTVTYPDNWCNEYWKVIWICIHTKLQCCLTLQFKTNIKEWYLLNWLRIMRYHSTVFGFLMRHVSTWMVWLINNIYNFEHQRGHMWFVRRCIMHWELQYGLSSQVMAC